MYIICAIVCAIYSVITRSRCDNILHVRVYCRCEKKKKLDYRGYFSVGQTANRRLVRCRRDDASVTRFIMAMMNRSSEQGSH